MYFPHLLKWVTKFITLKTHERIFIFLSAETFCGLCEWNVRSKQEDDWGKVGREVKDEAENENENQISKEFEFRVWVAVGTWRLLNRKVLW